MSLQLRMGPLDVRAIGAIRAGLGVAMITSPAVVPRLLGADRVTAERVSWLSRMLGAREVAIGLGEVAAGGSAAGRGWVAAGAVCDGVDCVALVTAVRRGHVNRVLGALVALTSAAAAIGGLAALAPRRDAGPSSAV